MTWISVAENLIAGLIAAGIMAVVSYFAIFRKASGKIIDYLKTVVNPVDSFRNVEEFSRLLLDTLDSYNDSYENAILFRAIPCELTEAFRRHVSGDVDTEAMKLINKYQRAVGVIIKSDKGAHDDSVFGKTGLPHLDDATSSVIEEHFLSGERAPGTTTLSFHENLNEYGVILFGINDEVCHIGDVYWKAGFLIVYSKDFKKIRGYRYNQDSHIENLLLMFEQKRDDSYSYEFVPELGRIERDNIRKNVKEFYSISD
ncbi:hypothetical protein DLR65_17440 [Vibrio tarriae]|uniref:hypothetical protein n=1 Tax=Vibrio tarriae TaxID=2014742 RepID=UPI000DE4825B|nr:hypothetical protein [Vibrio tarriae]RBM45945.1 hypothetical protein DLR65_17440 [Vibrio tarriae]